MCWREHSGPQEAGPAAQEHSTLFPPPGEQTSVDRGWICSPDSGEHSWGSWESGKDGGAGKGLNQRGHSSIREAPCAHREEAASDPRGSPGAPSTFASISRLCTLEEGIPTHSSVLAWRIPWTEEPGGLQSMGLQRSETT